MPLVQDMVKLSTGKMRDYEEAIKYFDNAIEINENYPDACMFLKALALDYSGNHGEAIKYAKKDFQSIRDDDRFKALIRK